MAFDNTPQYQGAIAAGDEGTPNLMNSLYVQRGTYANRPASGNKGVTFIATDGRNGLGAGYSEYIYWDDGTAWVELGALREPVSLEGMLEALMYG